jgi:hypothetical protein
MVLAADIDAPGAKAAMTALQARVGADQRAQAKIDPAAWQPTLDACLARDPRTRRPDGTTSYALTVIINRVLKDASATGDETRDARWLASALETVRTGSPRYLVYLKSLGGVGFTGKGSFVRIEQRDGLPMLAVNESFTDTMTPQRLTDFVKAAVIGVHEALVPPVIATETIAYKGYTLRTTSSEGGKKFVEHMKYAIDMVDQLPPELARLARAATDLRYEPQRMFDRRGGAITIGTWVHDPAGGKGHVSYTESFSMGGPSRLVITLVDGGIFARREVELVEARKQLAAARQRGAAPDIAKAEQQVKTLERTSKPSETGDCELEDYEIKTMEALKLDAIEINRAYKMRTQRNCS